MVAVNYDWDEVEDNIDEEYDDSGSAVVESDGTCRLFADGFKQSLSCTPPVAEARRATAMSLRRYQVSVMHLLALLAGTSIVFAVGRFVSYEPLTLLVSGLATLSVIAAVSIDTRTLIAIGVSCVGAAAFALWIFLASEFDGEVPIVAYLCGIQIFMSMVALGAGISLVWYKHKLGWGVVLWSILAISAWFAGPLAGSVR